MDGSVHVFLDDALADENGVLIVVSVPRNEANEDVASKGQLAVECGGTVSKDRTFDNLFADFDCRALVVASVVVCALVLKQNVFVNLAALSAFGFDRDAFAGNFDNFAGALGLDQNARVVGALLLHAGSDVRRLGEQKRNSLALHVAAHQGAVGVVVLQERNERG